MKRWYCIRIQGDKYIAQYKENCGDCWHTFLGDADTWEGAYDILCEHATPAALAVRFVGTF